MGSGKAFFVCCMFCFHKQNMFSSFTDKNSFSWALLALLTNITDILLLIITMHTKKSGASKFSPGGSSSVNSSTNGRRQMVDIS